MSLENKTAQFAHQVSFPITGAGFPNNIGAITLNIAIDTCVLHFDGYTAGTLPGVGANIVGTNVTVAWYNTNIININGIMLTLKFTYKGGSCALDFLTDYDIVTIDFQPVTCNFTDGSVSNNGEQPVTYYVDAAVSSSGNGLSWATALKTIHEATNKTLYPADNILVKPGSYTDTVVIKSSGFELRHKRVRAGHLILAVRLPQIPIFGILFDQVSEVFTRPHPGQ